MTMIRTTHIPVTREPSQSQWWYDTATGAATELFSYTSSSSLSAGDPIELRVHTTAPDFAVEVYRDGQDRDVVHTVASLAGARQGVADAPYRNGCDWPVTLAIDTEGWPSGPYVIRCSAVVDDRRLQHADWVALRPPRLSRDRLTLVASTCTWAAYNGWGGSSSYYGIDGPDANSFSPVLSFNRPWQAGTIWLPPGAPRISSPPRELGSHVHYEDLDWAYSHAQGKHYASAGWASYERHFVRWAEANGYGVDVLTQHDLHFRPELLEDAGVVVFVGHDEYWTWEMREHLDAFVDGGGQVARLAGNFMWQVRLSGDGATQTCYKHRAPSEDPVRDDPQRRHLLTHVWDLQSIEYPAARTFGCTGSRGIYAGIGGLAPRASAGFTVYRPEHWILAGTDARYGDVLGGESRVATYELDGLDYTIEGGLPYSTGADGVDPDSVEIVALCVCANRERDRVLDDNELDIGDADASVLAYVHHGEVTEETLDKVARGCGVVCEYRRGSGRVVSAASVEWVNGLRVGDPVVEQVTRNILDGLLSAAR
jgi:hypothetical protein